MNHEGHPHRFGGTPGEAQRFQAVVAHDGSGEADLEALNDVPVPLADADRPLWSGVLQILQFVVQRTDHAESRDVQECQHPRFHDLDDISSQALEGVCAG